MTCEDPVAKIAASQPCPDSGDGYDDSRMMLALMRHTRVCHPPGHCWPEGTVAAVGTRCRCGEVALDQAMRDALDWRCEG